MSDGVVDFYYWDLCIFLEYFRIKEPAPELQRQAIKRLLRENANRANAIFTSTITHVEVLPTKVTRDDEFAERKYLSMFGSKYFYEVEVSSPIIKLARGIKDFYYREGDPKTGTTWQMMDTGDAIHLATAIINGATEFHTRDNCKKRGNVPLLDLHRISPHGRVAGQYELRIRSPEEKQTDLLEALDAPAKT